MSQQKVETARSIYHGWVSGDVASALEQLDPQVIWEAIGDAPDAGTYRGHAGVRHYMEDWLRDFDIISMQFKNVVLDADDRLVIEQCGRARGKGSGAETEIHYAVAYRFHDGKIVELREFRTTEEALEAVEGPPRGGPSPGAISSEQPFASTGGT
jgi:ketosteroid isomerase-like protein